MKSLITKHSVMVKNHKTSISLEEDFGKPSMRSLDRDV